MADYDKLDPLTRIYLKLRAIGELDETRDDTELIIRYTGDIAVLSDKIGFTYAALYGGFAIITIPYDNLEALISDSDVLFIDRQKRMFYENIENEYNVSCMNISDSYTGINKDLTGRGVIVAIIDSGIDLAHPAFFDVNVLAVWNQNMTEQNKVMMDGVIAKSPFDYKLGIEYKREDYKSSKGSFYAPYNIASDITGHGTSVAGIAMECVPDAYLLFVKLLSGPENITDTSAIMLAIDYCISVARTLNLPVAINLSYGNNYGDHAGNSILEQYIDTAYTYAKITFVGGMGNDANKRKHALLFLNGADYDKRDILINDFQTTTYIQIWKSYRDLIDIYIILPSGDELGPINKQDLVYDYNVGGMRIFSVLSDYSPFSERELCYITIIPKEQYIGEGIWQIVLRPRYIMDGRVDMWLPVADGATSDIYFLRAEQSTTFTIPASANEIISVGAYNVNTLSYATFSGQGYTVSKDVKPDIVAPGTNLYVPDTGGGYTIKSGTSFSTPFVTAGAAMLMEWGITNENDPFMFGQKVKAAMRRGARMLPGFINFPNQFVGYGALCVNNSLPDDISRL